MDLSFETVSLPDELARVLRDYETAWRSNDEDAIAALFTEEGYAMPSGRRPVKGRDAIREAYARTGGNLILRAIDYRMNDASAHIVGVYTYNSDAGYSGKYLLILEMDESGRWMIAADMDNSNR
ncbi:MAG: DUF4440 domain-containing protein [Gemmatimonadetes bacterium]|nr:DUF4440 domain-containing protein [Gemmatimonadota bacterium]